VPYPINTFRGYRYLQNTFAFQGEVSVCRHRWAGGFAKLCTGNLLKRSPWPSSCVSSSIAQVRSASNPTLDNIGCIAPQWSTCLPTCDADPPGWPSGQTIHAAPGLSTKCPLRGFSVDSRHGWKPAGMAMRSTCLGSPSNMTQLRTSRSAPYYQPQTRTRHCSTGSMDTYLEALACVAWNSMKPSRSS